LDGDTLFYVNLDFKNTTQSAISIGYNLGIGLIIDKKINVEFRYLNLGSPNIGTTQELSGLIVFFNDRNYMNQTQNVNIKYTLSILSVRVGVIF